MTAYVEHVGLPFNAADDPAFAVDHILKRGYSPDDGRFNLALLDLATRHLDESHIEVPDELAMRRSELEARWLGSTLIRWLDTPAPGEPAEGPARSEMRLARMFSQIDSLRQVVYVTAPMRNERDEIDKFAASLTAVPLDTPVAAVAIGDSMSTDGSVLDVMLKHKFNVGRCFTRGIGPARRQALELIRDPKTAGTRLSSDNELYMITDTDATIAPGLTDMYARAFNRPENDSRLFANGPVHYSFLWPDRPLTDEAFLRRYTDSREPHRIHITDFASYRYFTGAASISELFGRHGRQVGEFIVGDRCHMLPGPNSCLRGSILDTLDGLPDFYKYPEDNRHEQIHLSVMLQSLLDFDVSGFHLDDPEASVTASERGIVGPQNYVLRQYDEPSQSVLTSERFAEIRTGTGILPYKVDLDQKAGEQIIDAATTVALVIAGLTKIAAGTVSRQGRPLTEGV